MLMSNRVAKGTFYRLLFFLFLDFQNGNDRNAGTSQSAPWKHIPGTRTANDTADVSTCWGSGCPGTPTFSRTNRVPAGTVFKLKSGTIHNSSNGGEFSFQRTIKKALLILDMLIMTVG